jgi:hypothetical protein
MSFVLLPNLKITSALAGSGGTFDNPDYSAKASFGEGWPPAIDNPLTGSDFATYDNSVTASFESPYWT